MISGLLVAVAAGSGKYPLVAFVAMYPLFASIRRDRPQRASLCGTIWGATFAAACLLGIGPSLIPSVLSLALLTIVPAVYCLLGSMLTRWIGFSPFVLGVGWAGVEFAMLPTGLGYGLLAATQSESVVMGTVGRALGFVLVAFVVAYVNAAVLVGVTAIVNGCRSHRHWTMFALPYCTAPRRAHTILQSFLNSPSHPRAPPSACVRPCVA